jgi:glycosyltransferase involved in cell wall biosynthesis
LNRRDLEHYRFLPRVRLIPNPVTPPAVPPGSRREKLIIAVGHLTPLKNFEDAIRAMHKSGLEEKGWSLAIIGSGPNESYLRVLIDELGLKRTHVHSPTEDLASWYGRASMLLVTSRLESFSLVLAEAMLCGVVPIAYASDGPSFILEDFPELLVEMGDVNTLSERLVRFAEEDELTSLRERLRMSAAKRFSPDTIVPLWQGLLS